MLDEQDRAKIQALYQEIGAVYKESVARPSGNVCDICGDGDKPNKIGIMRKVFSVAHGYEHRQWMSPKLCHTHAAGWGVSYTKSNWESKPTDDEIDLLFAKFLARNLCKAATHAAKKSTGEQA
jgi:hypothetical protein